MAYADLYAFKQFGLRDKPAMLLGMSTLRHFARVSIDFPAREVRFLLGLLIPPLQFRHRTRRSQSEPSQDPATPINVSTLLSPSRTKRS